MGNAKDMKSTVAGSADDGREQAGESAIGGAVAEVKGWPARTKAFVADVRAELKRVSWPTMTQVKATTVVVLVAVAFFATYLGVLDWLYTQGVQMLLNYGR
jgi:preprotein translocase subunit SecE